jgi:prolyl-tRNA synthetase
MGCTYLDQNGQEQPLVMGSYGIGSGRLLACVAEEHHDEHGLIWPASVAPYPVHLVLLGGKSTQQGRSGPAQETADNLAADLKTAGLEPLYDDRPESPGVKFNDADLIGLPIRLTVSDRSLSQGGVEFKRRDQAEKVIVPLEEVIGRVRNNLQIDR